MCSRVSNVLSGVPRLIDPVVAVLSSVSSKVSSVAQAHWTSLAGEEVSGDFSSHWEYIKDQCRICWGMASACIQQVAQTFYLFMTGVSDSETGGDDQNQTGGSNAGSLNYNRVEHRNLIMNAVRKDGLRLGRSYSAPFTADKEVVLVAVASSGRALRYASESLQADEEVVLAAVAQNGLALNYVSAGLQADKRIVLTAVSQWGGALRFAYSTLKADKEVALAAVTQDGYALQFASEALRADKEVVLAAVARTGSALAYASAELQMDPDVLQAVSRR